MELRHLLALQAVLDTGSFTAGAAARHLSQPALWAQIKELETELGLTLFTRAGRGIAPTAACDALRDRLSIALQSVADLGAAAAQVREGTLAPPRVGCGPSFVAFFLADCITELLRRNAGAPFPVIVQITTGNAIETIVRGDLDLLLEPRAKPALPGSVPICSMRLVALGPATRGAHTVDLGNLHGVRLATWPTDSLVRRMLEEAARTHGVTVHVAYETRDAPALTALAERDLCTIVVPEEALDDEQRARAALLTAGGKHLAVPIWLAWRDEAALSPAALTLRDIILERAEPS